jgi:hypothetical protein
MSNEEFDAELLSQAKARMSWIDYKGKEILYDDYSGLTGDEMAKLIPVITHLTFESGKKDILLIVDVSNGYANKAAVSQFGESGNISKHLLTKTAVLGITGVKKILLNVVNTITSLNAKPFSSAEEAKEYLISE